MCIRDSFYGGDAGTTKYSALDQINGANAKDLKIVWEWKAQNFGKRPDFNWEVTPLMAGGVLYFTAGTRRDAVAVSYTHLDVYKRQARVSVVRGRPPGRADGKSGATSAQAASERFVS